ncbi:MAG TPA: hypothetical protein VG325_18765, partial [Solirubrobacteraceae bacterium]|nr:hypothetical protein [Solirubrobacteraceae bacterium]
MGIAAVAVLLVVVVAATIGMLWHAGAGQAPGSGVGHALARVGRAGAETVQPAVRLGGAFAGGSVTRTVGKGRATGLNHS